MAKTLASLSQVRTAVGDKYLRGRPSLARMRAKLGKQSLDISEDDYAELMRGMRRDIKTLPDLMQECEVSDSAWNVKRLRLGAWDGKVGVRAELVPHSGCGDIKLPTPRKIKRAKPAESRAAVLICPDVHFGYVVGDDQVLTPIHDELAVACFVAAVAATRPAKVVILGDLLDLAPFGSYPTKPGHRHTTHHALQAAYDFLVQLRQYVDDIVLIKGNHEERLDKMLAAVATEALSLRRPGDCAPLMSLRHLLRLDELNIRCVAPYGAQHWIGDVCFMHGKLLGSAGGATVAKLLKHYQHTVVCGHGHRLELAYRCVEYKGKPRRWYAMMCGTLARLDGVVPGTEGEIPDWCSGFGAIDLCGFPQAVEIRDGMCSVLGVTCRAEDV